MHARALALAVFLTATLLAAPAHAEDVVPEAPVVVDDAVTLWPGAYAEIDVLANDSDPAGDDLALCRMPPLWSPEDENPATAVSVLDESIFDGPVGTVMVQAGPRARGTHVIDYYVCNHTRLTPAHLTVTIRPVQPVDVVPPRMPDRIRVTNHNDRGVLFIATDKTGCLVDIHARVDAGETRTFRVRRHALRWYAFIGSGSDRGIADYGTVRGIDLTRPSAEPGPDNEFCSYAWSRQLPGIGASGS